MMWDGVQWDAYRGEKSPQKLLERVDEILKQGAAPVGSGDGFLTRDTLESEIRRTKCVETAFDMHAKQQQRKATPMAEVGVTPEGGILNQGLGGGGGAIRLSPSLGVGGSISMAGVGTGQPDGGRGHGHGDGRGPKGAAEARPLRPSEVASPRMTGSID